MAGYSNNRLYSNLWTLAKKSDIGVTEMERRVGTYPGYLLGHKNRTSQQGIKSGKHVPDMEVIWRFSKMLGISINDLIEGDYSHEV